MGYLSGELPISVEYGERVDIPGNVVGACHLTNYRFGFQSGAQSFEIPLKLISKLSQEKESIHIYCKDARLFILKFVDVKLGKSFYDKFKQYAFPFKIEDLFAYKHGHSKWSLNIEEEYNRCCLDVQKSLRLFESSHWDHGYKSKQDYPSMFAVHVDVSDKDLLKMGPHRDGHVPAAVWAHPTSGAILARCGQSRGDRCVEDDKLIAGYRDAAENKRSIAVVDVHTPIGSWGAQIRVRGADHRERKNDLPITNLADVRTAMEGVFELTVNGSSRYEEDNYLIQLAKTGWLGLLKRLLEKSSWVADRIEQEKISVVLYCQDGSDGTPQLTSLAQILLDPYYRTIQGFALLVEKEWVQFGHKFALRVGHKFDKNDNPSERSPIFIQFLHAVWQLTAQFPHAFEFNEVFLLTIADHVTSCRFGTFLCDNAKERAVAGVEIYTRSLWDYVLASRSRFQNASFTPETCRLVPRFQAKFLRLWDTFFLRYDAHFGRFSIEPDMLPLSQPSSASLVGLSSLFRQKSEPAPASLPSAGFGFIWRALGWRAEEKTAKFFEVSVEEALQHSAALSSNLDPSLPAPVSVLFRYLETYGLNTEGLFRISADGATVNQQVAAWKRGEIPQVKDPLVAADVLKRYFRTLPQPLIPPQHYLGFVNVARMPASEEEKKIMYRNMVASIPQPHGHVLRCLIAFLARVAARSSVNQMTAYNLAVCWAPNLLSSELTTKEVPEHSKLVIEVIKTLIANAADICSSSVNPVPLAVADPGQTLRISVIGNTGIGKRTFIKLCTQSKILVDNARVRIKWSTECGPPLLEADVVLACFSLQYYPSYFSLMTYAEKLRNLKKPTVLLGLQSDGKDSTAHFNVEEAVQELAACSYRCCFAHPDAVMEVVEEAVRQALSHAKVGSVPAVQIARIFQNKTGVEINLPGADARQLRDVSFPLKDITKKSLFYVEEYLQPNNDAGPRRALHGALMALKNLASIDNKLWQERALQEVHVGLIKATSDCGNTSVSMGLAATFFAKHPAAQHVALLNFGTGGVRFQLYVKNATTGIVSCLLEYKPPGRNKGLVSKLKVGGYSPTDPVDPKTLQAEILEGLADAPWNNDALKKKFNIKNVTMFAFITGPLRNYWETHAQESKMISEFVYSQLSEVLGAESCYSQILDQHSEYLIPQQLEGTMELVANRTLYRQYSALTGQKLMPIVSLGVGKGSSQWTSLDSDFRLADDFLTYKLEPVMQFGMDCPDLAERLGSAIVQSYEGKIETLARLILAVRDAGWTPVIALKSGCLLALDEPSSGGKLRKSLVELNPPSGPEALMFIRRREQAFSNPSDISRPLPAVVDCRLPRCLPLACAKASQLLRKPGDKVIPDFLRVEYKGQFLSDLSEVPKGSTLVFWTAKDLLSKPSLSPSEEKANMVKLHIEPQAAPLESKTRDSVLPRSPSELDLVGEVLPNGRKTIIFVYGEEILQKQLRPTAQKLTSLIANLCKVLPGARTLSLYYPVSSVGSSDIGWFQIDNDETLSYALGISNTIVCLEQNLGPV